MEFTTIWKYHLLTYIYFQSSFCFIDNSYFIQWWGIETIQAIAQRNGKLFMYCIQWQVHIFVLFSKPTVSDYHTKIERIFQTSTKSEKSVEIREKIHSRAIQVVPSDSAEVFIIFVQYCYLNRAHDQSESSFDLLRKL